MRYGINNWRAALCMTLGTTCRACFGGGGYHNLDCGCGECVEGVYYVIPMNEVGPGDAIKIGWHTRRRAAALRHYRRAHPDLVKRFFQ